MELKWNMLPFILNHVMNIFIPTTDEYRSSCGDLIFSGHTASLMTLYLVRFTLLLIMNTIGLVNLSRSSS